MLKDRQNRTPYYARRITFTLQRPGIMQSSAHPRYAGQARDDSSWRERD
jgi:hypothetical protein